LISLLNNLAKLLSYLLHPVFMPSYAVYLLLNNSTFKMNEKIGWLIYALVFLNTCLLPVFATLILKKFGLVSSMQINAQEERSTPYLISFIFFSSTWWLLNKAPLPPIVAQLMLGASIAILFTGIINLKMKISAHMVGIGGATGAFLVVGLTGFQDFSIFVIAGVFIAGCLGWARLQLNAHTPKEVYSGFLLGVLCQLIADKIA
jgi:membrane-associated phospholipid phosphatase